VRRSPRRTPDIGGDCVERWRSLPFLRYAPCHFSRGFLAQEVAVAVAHPGDETIGCGALLSRMSAVPVIVAADGPEADGQQALALGFPNAESYASARRAEWSAALDIAAIPENRRMCLGFAAQRAAEHLPDLARQFADTFRERKSHIVLTHAFEGGHPDHDAVAMAVHLAARILERASHTLFIFEMPFYRLGESGPVYQSFSHEAVPEIVIAVSPEEQKRKRGMMESFVSQRQALAPFDVSVERFRAAPAHRFARLPNDGQVYYEQQGGGMSGDRWRTLAASALEEIGGLAAQ
jgi:LmbE family N-acetylglucosaminyl deacetylase